MYRIHKGKRLSGHRLKTALCGLLVFFALSINGLAEGSLPSYTYNAWDEAVETVPPYRTELVISGKSLGIGDFQAPKDIVVTSDRDIYILDSGNNRLVVLDRQFELKRQIYPMDENGEPLVFGEALGLFVTEDTLLVADKEQKCVYTMDLEGNVLGRIVSPDASLLPPDFDFTPTKVLVNSAGIVHVISSNTYSGAMQYTSEGDFIGFFGSEKVDVTPGMMFDLLWRKVLTKEQQEGMKRYVPATFTNFDVDKNDFIYTVRQTGEEYAQVRMLNPLGVNILPETKFGEKETTYDQDNKIAVSSLIQDVTVDDEGFLSIVDSSRGRIFQYDTNSQMLFAFGAKGNQVGALQQPTAIDNMDGYLLVLDEALNNLSVYALTDFGAAVRQGVRLYNDGQYMACEPYWIQVLQNNAGYQLANIGMGKIYEKRGDYSTAQAYFRLGNDRKNFSNVFKQSRDAGIRQHFPLFMCGLLALILIPVVLSILRGRHKKNEYDLHVSVRAFPFYCIFHPFKAYYEMKVQKKGSFGIACGILIGLFLFRLLYIQFAGFPFNENRPDQLNIFVELLKTVGAFVVWVVCNWAVTTLMSGEGKLTEIWIFSAYALLPYVLTQPLMLLLSNVFTLEESVFMGMFSGIILLWTGVNLLMAIKEVHQYTVAKTIGTACISVASILIVALILTIVYSMFAQLVGFVSMVINEIRLR